jgi:hypothetical protein
MFEGGLAVGQYVSYPRGLFGVEAEPRPTVENPAKAFGNRFRISVVGWDRPTGCSVKMMLPVGATVGVHHVADTKLRSDHCTHSSIGYRR